MVIVWLRKGFFIIFLRPVEKKSQFVSSPLYNHLLYADPGATKYFF
jgi:hypothetical protein